MPEQKLINGIINLNQMEKRIKRIEIVVFLTLLLVLISFITPIIQNLDFSSAKDKETKATKDLPLDLTRDDLNKIVYKIKTDFNSSDWVELYDVLGELAKAQINPDDVEGGFIKLKSATGIIESYAYSHYLFDGFREDAEWYVVYYKCRFENGKGTIKISFRTIDTISEVTGVNILLDEL